jgi:hypothetical protein
MKFNKEAFSSNHFGPVQPVNDIKINNEYKKINKLPVLMPDLTGLKAGEIINIFNKVNIKIKVYGNCGQRPYFSAVK